MARRRDVDRLQNEIEELFSDLWQVPRFAGLRRGFRPAVDAYRTHDPEQLTVVVELPGVDPADVRVDATPTALVVSGVRHRPKADGMVFQQMELDYGPFRREVALGGDVDTDAATATYRDGLLTIVLPVARRPPRPVKVPIDVRSRP